MANCNVPYLDASSKFHPPVSFYLNLLGEFTYADASFTQLTDYPPAALQGQPIARLLDPAARAATEPLLQRALQGEVLAFEVRLLHPTGQNKHLLLTTFPLLEQHEVVGVGVVARQAEAARQADAGRLEQEQLSIVFRSISDVIFVLAVEPGPQYRFLFVNQAFMEATGLPMEAVRGQLVHQVIPEPSLSLVLTHYQQAVDTHQPVAWLETTDYPAGQRVGEVSVTPVLDETGTCYQLVGRVHDLTAQKRVEEALRASNERFSYALKATTDAIYDWDIAADTLLWGEGYEALFGYQLASNPSTFGQWADFVHPDDVSHTVDDLHYTIAHTQHHHWQQEYRYECANGSWALVFDRGYIIRDATGQAVRMIGAMQDITARKAAEEKHQRMAQELFRQNADLQQFTYIVSHNLRAPLANARGYASLLTRTRQDVALFDTSLAYLQTSLAQLDTIMADVNTILSIRNTAQVSRSALVSLATVCDQVCQQLAPALLECGGTVRCALPQDLQVPGNYAYFYSIFYNLLANAIKYRSEHRPLHVEVVSSAGTEKEVIVRVADNGQGFDLQKAGNKVFGLYQRFHTAPPGQGLGLFLVKSHLEAMGGHVEVSSQVAEGTCFTLHLASS
jgi:PAS domain S-box-containing protein